MKVEVLDDVAQTRSLVFIMTGKPFINGFNVALSYHWRLIRLVILRLTICVPVELFCGRRP